MESIEFSRPSISQLEINAVIKVLKSGWLTSGPVVEEFEEEFAGYIGVKHAIAMNSCTSALMLAIMANGIKGEVIIPSFTWVATANAVINAGAKPVFADITYHSCNIDPSSIERKITKSTEAIIVVHFAGQCVELDQITNLCQKYKLLLIEDSAQTVGGEYKGKKTGTFGTGCFSFFPTKNITTGEGGMVTTNDSYLAEKIKKLVAHGVDKNRQKGKFWERTAVDFGYNFRLSDILAAIGLTQLNRINELNNLRRIKADYLLNQLSVYQEYIDLPYELPETKHVYQMFTIKMKNEKIRGKIVDGLKVNKINASVHFDPPIHRQEIYRQFGSNLPITDEVSNKILSIPFYPDIDYASLDYIVKTFGLLITQMR